MKPTAIVLLLLALPVLAEEPSVYESVEELSIGRVFLSPAERRWLDARRGQTAPAQAEVSASTEAASEDVERREPAGYILSSSGQTRVWNNGRFASQSSAPAELQFPNDIAIRRHVVTQDAGPDAEGAEDATEQD